MLLRRLDRLAVFNSLDCGVSHEECGWCQPATRANQPGLDVVA
jgi:hypothetical protein